MSVALRFYIDSDFFLTGERSIVGLFDPDLFKTDADVLEHAVQVLNEQDYKKNWTTRNTKLYLEGPEGARFLNKILLKYLYWLRDNEQGASVLAIKIEDSKLGGRKRKSARRRSRSARRSRSKSSRRSRSRSRSTRRRSRSTRRRSRSARRSRSRSTRRRSRSRSTRRR